MLSKPLELPREESNLISFDASINELQLLGLNLKSLQDKEKATSRSEQRRGEGLFEPAGQRLIDDLIREVAGRVRENKTNLGM